MMTRPAPLGADYDSDPAERGTVAAGLLAAIGRALAAAFSWSDPGSSTTEELPQTANARAKRLMRSGD